MTHHPSRSSIVVVSLLTLLLGESLSGGEWNTLRIHEQFVAEGASAGDIDGDGSIDLVAGPTWYRGPEFLQSFPIATERVFPVSGYSDQFFSRVLDANRDGANDVLVLGFPGKAARLYLNPGHDKLDQEWSMIEVAETVDNESPAIVDLVPGGLPEIICGRDGHYGYYQSGADATAPWKWTPVTQAGACGGKFTHALGCGDVNGDGRLDLLDKTFWWEQPDSHGGDSPWEKHRWNYGEVGRGGAQIRVSDVDGDGDSDIVTSLDAHGFGLAWFEQGEAERFRRHDIMGESSTDNSFGVAFSQLHAVELRDMNNDGLQDIVTGKRWMAHNGHDAGGLQEPVIYWFQCVRNSSGIDFVPRIIDRDSGVGVDVLVADLNADQKPDVVSCSKRGLAIHFQKEDIVSSAPQTWKQIAGTDQTKYADGLEPAEAAKNMLVPDGFHVDLIASEPELTQPIAMCFDARGRIWVVEGHTYPTKAPEGEGRDRVVIFEDTDADGSFETKTTFIEGLNLASGIEIGFGGIWIGAAPHLLFIPDADRDDVPDAPPQIMLDGWGYHDTHETLNSFTWGPDGWLYGCHGVFTHSNVGQPGAPDNARQKLNGGVWRYHPTEHSFEVFSHGTSNPWGVDFDDRGQWFITACVIPHLYHIQKGGRFQRQAGQHFNRFTYDDIKTIADHAHFAGNIRDHAFWGDNKIQMPSAPLDTSMLGGGHAHCGLAIYNADVFPREYYGDMLFHNLHGHRLVRERLDRDGSGFVGRHRPDFAFARDHKEIGVGVMVGPDGAIYTSDWHDIQTCHNRESEVWDRTDGRLFRIRYGDVRPQQFDLWAENDAQLINRLTSNNGFFARQAQRILHERAATGALDTTTVLATLDQMIRADAGSTDAFQRDRLRAMWTMWCVGGFDDNALTELLADADEYVRSWAVHFIGETLGRGHASGQVDALAALSQSDDSIVVRRHLASLLQDLPLESRWPFIEGLTKHTTDQHDRNLPFLVWYGMEPLVESDPDRAYALAKTSRWPILLRHTIRRTAVTPSGRDLLVARLADPAERPLRLMMLEELNAAATSRGGVDMPEQWPIAFRQLIDAPLPRVRQLTRSVAVQFGDEAVLPFFRSILSDSSQPKQQRLEALTALRTARDSELPKQIVSLLRERTVSAELVAALAQFNDATIPSTLLNQYTTFDDATKTAALNTLVARPAWAGQLVTAMETGAIKPTAVPAFIVRQAMTLRQQDLNERLEKVWGRIGESSADKQELYAKYRRLLRPAAIQNANASRGRVVYEANCGKCHKLFGVGGAIGPDITGANRTKVDYWLENILDPNALIGKAYQVTSIVTVDGRVVSGIIKERNEDAVTVQTATEIVVVSQDDIAETAPSKASIMPEGQLQTLTDAQALDLFKYLMGSTQVPLPPTMTLKDATATGLSENKAQASPQPAAQADASLNQPWKTKPNFVVIFCDDMGYADIGPFGASGYETPHLNRMAAEGMTFTDFHVAQSFCSPSRAALLTGRYPFEVGVAKNFFPGSPDGLAPNASTLANVLQSVGYDTACFGKWHLGHRPQYLPTSRGFDQFFGLPYSNDMWPFHPENGTRFHFPDLPLLENDRVVKAAITPADQQQLTRQLTNRAIEFITSHASSTVRGTNRAAPAPFFLYLPYPMPHVPLYTSAGFHKKTPRGLYGDVISEIDWGVGQILATLQASALEQNTLVVFTSDNGPWLTYGEHAGSAGPLRAGKGSIYEGGYRVPCVMRWPGTIPADRECHSFAATIDLMPTFASLAGAPVPDAAKIDGKDIRAQLLGRKQNPHAPRTFVHFRGNKPAAVRRGKWKLIFPTQYRKPIAGKGGRPGGSEKAQAFPLALYDLQEDVGERNNVANRFPQIVSQLKQIADDHR